MEFIYKPWNRKPSIWKIIWGVSLTITILLIASNRLSAIAQIISWIMLVLLFTVNIFILNNRK